MYLCDNHIRSGLWTLSVPLSLPGAPFLCIYLLCSLIGLALSINTVKEEGLSELIFRRIIGQ